MVFRWRQKTIAAYLNHIVDILCLPTAKSTGGNITWSWQFQIAKGAGAFKAPAPHRTAPTRSDAFSSTSELNVSSTVFLTRFFMSLRSDSSSTYTMFADTTRAPSSMICCLAARNHMTGRGSCPPCGCQFVKEITCHHAKAHASIRLFAQPICFSTNQDRCGWPAHIQARYVLEHIVANANCCSRAVELPGQLQDPRLPS